MQKTLKHFKVFLKYLKPYKKEIRIFVVLGVLSAALNSLTPFIVGKFIDALSALYAGDANSNTISLYLILLAWFIVAILSNILSWITRIMSVRFRFKTDADLNVQAIDRILQMPSSFHKEYKVGKMRYKIEQATSWTGHFLEHFFNQYVIAVVGIFTGLFMVFYISVQLAIVLLAGMILYIYLAFALTKELSKKQKRGHEAWSDAYSKVYDALSNVLLLKVFSSEKIAMQTIAKSFNKAWRAWLVPEFVWANVNFLQGLLVSITQAVIFLYSIRLVMMGVLSIGDLVAINSYALAAFGPVVMFLNQMGDIQMGLLQIYEADKLLQKKTENYHLKGAKKPSPFIPEIEFKNAHFYYSKKEGDILKGVSFKIDAGQTVAFVGESGVGKSTSIELILAFAFPQRGSVLVSGVNTKKLDLEYLRKNIALVPQETTLFNDTILANLRFAKAKASEKEIWEALEKAQLADFVRSLPKGLKSKVGERGVKLSVGQKQRISIARAFLKDAPIVILDEPTSALDAKTEHALKQTFDELVKDRTAIIIAHRLATVRKADKIIVFDKGRVAEEGKHEELIQKESGVYRKLYELQKL